MRTRETLTRLAVSTLTIALVSAAAGAARSDEVVEGTIVEIRQVNREENRADGNEVLVRTRSGETRRLRLGPLGSCSDCVVAGDTVRARVMAGAAAGGERVRTMAVRRTGEKLVFCKRTGEPVRDRTQLRARDGTGRGSGPQAGPVGRSPRSGPAAGPRGGRRGAPGN